MIPCGSVLTLRRLVTCCVRRGITNTVSAECKKTLWWSGLYSGPRWRQPDHGGYRARCLQKPISLSAFQAWPLADIQIIDNNHTAAREAYNALQARRRLRLLEFPQFRYGPKP